MTLTEMLEHQENHRPLTTEIVKYVFKEWLGEVGLPDYYVELPHDLTENATQLTRDLLVILVDEPDETWPSEGYFKNPSRFEGGI